jgi:hypothetical protein
MAAVAEIFVTECNRGSLSVCPSLGLLCWSWRSGLQVLTASTAELQQLRRGIERIADEKTRLFASTATEEISPLGCVVLCFAAGLRPWVGDPVDQPCVLAVPCTSAALVTDTRNIHEYACLLTWGFSER